VIAELLKNTEKGKKESWPTYHDLKPVNDLLKEEITQLVVENSKLTEELKELKTLKQAEKSLHKEEKKRMSKQIESFDYETLVTKQEFELFDYTEKMRLACCARTVNRLESTSKFL